MYRKRRDVFDNLNYSSLVKYELKEDIEWCLVEDPIYPTDYQEKLMYILIIVDIFYNYMKFSLQKFPLVKYAVHLIHF